MGTHAIKHKNGIEVMPGNNKVQGSIIFNMGAGMDCPSAKFGLCRIGQTLCYACKNERFRKTSLAFRRRQEIQWKTKTDMEYIEALTCAIEKTGFDSIRFNESGDFWGQKCVQKLSRIAENIPGILFFGYTARKDLDFGNLPENLVISGSGFMVHNEFGPYYPDSKFRCPGNCGLCNFCKTRGNRVIFNPMH